MIIKYGGFINYYLYLLCVIFYVHHVHKQNLKETAFNHCAQ